MPTICKFTFAASIMLAALVASHAPATLAGEDAGASVQKLEAAYIFNFLKFVEWPPDGTDDQAKPLVLAVVGEGPIVSAIENVLDGKTAQGRKLSVFAYSNVSAWTSDAARCHALFVTSYAWPEWAAMRAAIANRAVLTIADSPGFCAAGGMLNIFEYSNRFRFEANPSAAGQAGPKIRADLLKLATIVHTLGAP